MNEWTLTAENVSFFRANLDLLLDELVSFKVGKPNGDQCSNPTELSVDIRREGEPLKQLIDTFSETILQRSINFGSPQFVAHPDAGNSVAGLIGEISSIFMQQNLTSAEYSPIATKVEHELLKILRSLVGYDISGPGLISAGGAFVFGGSGSNFSCLLAARERLKKKCALEGRIYNPRKTRLIANGDFTHYSLKRSLYLLGFGNNDLSEEHLISEGLSRESIKLVPSAHFRMDESALEGVIEDSLEKGEDILGVFAVSGDSRMMAFDNLPEIRRVSEKYKIWMHVDACEGGQVLFSPNRKHLMEGICDADSIALDPHKVLVMPYNLSAFLLRDSSDMLNVSGGAATEIQQGNFSFGSFTPAVGSKAFISLKLWFFLKHWGWDRLAREIESRHNLAKKAANFILNHPDLVLINSRVEHNSVAFMFKGTKNPETSLAKLNKLNKQIREQLNSDGEYFIHGFSAKDDECIMSDERSEVWPMRIMPGNPATKWIDIENCLNHIVSIGNGIS